MLQREDAKLTPKHLPADVAKLANLLEVFKRHDCWPTDMPALLVDGQGQLYTGSHRYAAAKAAGLDDAEIPTEVLPHEILDDPDLADWDDWGLAVALNKAGYASLAVLACDDWRD